MHHKEIDYGRARNLILQRLKRDKRFHEQGLCEKMGESDDDFDREFPWGSSDLMLAWTFWDAWIAERNQAFPNIYSGITKDDWPKLAVYVIEQLENKATITDSKLLTHFDFLQKSGSSSILSLMGSRQDGRQGNKSEVDSTQFQMTRNAGWIKKWWSFLKFSKNIIK
ncbi:MAG TPA: hypothetical protein VJA17_00060 [Candidatus Omnitrophota bacterium]|nr:hypothetical protein [Candidatus Omnitrophota bacterium]